MCFTKNKFSSAQRGLSEPLCVKFTIQAEKSRIITHLTVRLKENIVYHQMAASYGNFFIIMGGNFIVHFEISHNCQNSHNINLRWLLLFCNFSVLNLFDLSFTSEKYIKHFKTVCMM